MSDLQNLTVADNDIDDVVPIYKYELLNPIQQAYIDWKAVSGLITDDDGIHKITLDELASRYKIVRQTFYDQTKHIPNLNDLISQRRKQIAPVSRIAKVHETWYLKAVKGEWQHMHSWLINFDPDYVQPTQKVEHQVGDTMAEALGISRKRREAIEGEVVSDSNIN